ncbi:MAG: hypothetical protein QM728_13940 [Gordonia sp. (in: high G+C Gram-positive bacteria)]|uniref:hypothetical protein n=1 Tax=Gordonia sp. (in: high G+C Gram-positive bacteria) TaxID=84139 RepID=UPI0039E3FC53
MAKDARDRSRQRFQSRLLGQLIAISYTLFFSAALVPLVKEPGSQPIALYLPHKWFPKTHDALVGAVPPAVAATVVASLVALVATLSVALSVSSRPESIEEQASTDFWIQCVEAVLFMATIVSAVVVGTGWFSVDGPTDAGLVTIATVALVITVVLVSAIKGNSWPVKGLVRLNSSEQRVEKLTEWGRTLSTWNIGINQATDVMPSVWRGAGLRLLVTAGVLALYYLGISWWDGATFTLKFAVGLLGLMVLTTSEIALFGYFAVQRRSAYRTRMPRWRLLGRPALEVVGVLMLPMLVLVAEWGTHRRAVILAVGVPLIVLPLVFLVVLRFARQSRQSVAGKLTLPIWAKAANNIERETRLAAADLIEAENEVAEAYRQRTQR